MCSYIAILALVCSEILPQEVFSLIYRDVHKTNRGYRTSEWGEMVQLRKSGSPRYAWDL